MNFLIKSLGCKVNQYETQALTEALIKSGHTAFNDITPDVVIINSCTVTAESDRKTRQLIRSAKRNYPEAVIVLTGCMVQAFPEKVKNNDSADIIIGNRDLKSIIKAISQYKEKKIFSVPGHKTGDKFFELPVSGFFERTRAFMKIEDGCNRYCSYCIIPKARGFVRSRPLEEIKSEAKQLADNGYLEVVLVGINLSAYGQESGINICDAVETVSRIDGIKRIRLGSLEPDHITDDMLKRLLLVEKFCPQFHLSLQSGCDETLKRMNRHYDTAFYLDLVRRIRRFFPTAAITTDIMVGFAGETEEEFQKSVAFVKKIGFARAHIFSYSRRTGTPAATLTNQVSNAEKKRRSGIMSDITKTGEKEFLSNQIGSVQNVLFETDENGFQEGYTENYTRVHVDTKERLTGQILPVLIVDSKDRYCTGKLV